jgi:three-Cys-motif partner protein
MDFVAKAPERRVPLRFIERDKLKAQQLQRTLQKTPSPASVSFRIFAADAEDLIGQVLATLEKRGKVIPTFFFIDLYGYPLPILTMRKLLALPKAEILVNLMWFRISMDLGNPQTWGRLDTMFGHQRWRTKHLELLRGEHREAAFISYFQEEVAARYHVPFPMTYSPKDRVSVPDKRNKYYLIHFSGYHSGALAMEEVMHRVRGKLRKLYSPMEQLAFDYGQPENPLTPLKTALLRDSRLASS